MLPRRLTEANGAGGHRQGLAASCSLGRTARDLLGPVCDGLHSQLGCRQHEWPGTAEERDDAPGARRHGDDRGKVRLGRRQKCLHEAN